MGLVVSPLNNISFKTNFQKTIPKNQTNSDNNPISRKGETASLIKATFLGGLALGVRFLWEIADNDEHANAFFEIASEKAAGIVNKTHKNISSNKRTLLVFGATSAFIAAGLSGFALLYTMLNAKKISYNGKVNTFQKGKEMDVYIKANDAERELYTQLSNRAKSANKEEKENLKEQYMKMRMAKNQVPDFIRLKK